MAQPYTRYTAPGRRVSKAPSTTRFTGVRTAPQRVAASSGPHPAEFWAMPVKQRQLFLRNRGYNVKVDGKSGPQTFAASWAYQHKLPTKVFNNQGRDWQTTIWHQYGPKPRATGAITHVLKSASKIVGRNQHAPNDNKAHAGNTNPPGNARPTNQSYGPPALGDALPPGLEVDQSDVIAPQLGNTQTLLDPASYADTAAGAEYDPQIYDTQVQQAKQAAQAPANLAQIQKLYDTVGASQATAATQDTAAADSAVKSQEAMVAGLVASLGGSANQGAAGVAQAGLDNTALIRSLGLIQAGTDANIGTAIKAENADAQVNQGRIDASRSSDLAAQLLGLKGQRGGAVAAARLDALKYNNDARNTNFTNAQHIREVNLDTEQQNFQNKIAAQQAIIAARAAGDSHTAAMLQNAYALAYPGQALGKSTTKKGHTITPSDVARATTSAQRNLLVKDPDTGRMVLDPRLQHNPQAVVAAVNAGFAGLHSTNKSVLAARNRILRMYGVTPQAGWKF